MAPSDQIRSNSLSLNGKFSMDASMVVIRLFKPFSEIWSESTSRKSGKRSTAVIFPSRWLARVRVCPPVPHPISAISRFFWPIRPVNSMAFIVTWGLPGPCLCMYLCRSTSKSNSFMQSVLDLSRYTFNHIFGHACGSRR